MSLFALVYGSYSAPGPGIKEQDHLVTQLILRCSKFIYPSYIPIYHVGYRGILVNTGYLKVTHSARGPTHIFVRGKPREA